MLEDPDVWVDEGGHYHAVFHRGTGCTVPWVCVGYAFSLDDKTWHYPFVNGSVAAGWNASTVDGGMLVFNRREWPHIVLGKDGATPVALTNGVGIVSN